MGRLGLLFGRRVPLYICLPIVAACGAAGYLASTTTLRPIIESQGQIDRVAEPSDAAAAPQQNQPSGAAVPSIALPTFEVDLPTPAPTVVERKQAVSENISDATAPVPVTKAMPERHRERRVLRSASNSRQFHRVMRQPKSAPATGSKGLQSIPLLGPVLSLVQ